MTESRAGASAAVSFFSMAALTCMDALLTARRC
jgi:hypothetical protein